MTRPAFGGRRSRAAAAIALALALSASVAGCTNPIDAIGQGIGDAVGDAVENSTGARVETGEEIPADFPESVPLIAGDVSNGNALTLDGATTWTVAIVTAEPVAATFAGIRTAIVGAGYTENAVTETADAANGVFSGEFSVIVTLSKTDAGTEAIYVVTPIGQ